LWSSLEIGNAKRALTETLDLPLPDAADVDLGNVSIFSVGTATVIIRYAGLTVMIDPNFLHSVDHVPLGFGSRQSGIVST
jgi:hypothetical protein